MRGANEKVGSLGERSNKEMNLKWIVEIVLGGRLRRRGTTKALPCKGHGETSLFFFKSILICII